MTKNLGFNTIHVHELFTFKILEQVHSELLNLFNFCKENDFKEKCVFEKNAFKTMNLMHLVEGKKLANFICSEINQSNAGSLPEKFFRCMDTHDLQSFHIVEYAEDGYEEPNYNMHKDSFFIIFSLKKNGKKQLKVYKEKKLNNILIYGFAKLDQVFAYPAGWAREVVLTDKTTTDMVAFFHFIYNPKKIIIKENKDQKKKFSFKNFIKNYFLRFKK